MYFVLLCGLLFLFTYAESEHLTIPNSPTNLLGLSDNCSLPVRRQVLESNETANVTDDEPQNLLIVALNETALRFHKKRDADNEESNENEKEDEENDAQSKQFFIVNWNSALTKFADEIDHLLEIHNQTQCLTQIMIGNLNALSEVTEETLKQFRNDLETKDGIEQVLIMNWHKPEFSGEEEK